MTTQLERLAYRSGIDWQWSTTADDTVAGLSVRDRAETFVSELRATCETNNIRERPQAPMGTGVRRATSRSPRSLRERPGRRIR